MLIAVCDDQDLILNEEMFMIDDIINEHGYKAEVCGFKSGEELLSEVEKRNVFYDIYILDISINDINGIEIAKRIRKLDKESIIVFVTGYDEYMIQAFDVQAFQYVLKPLSREKMEAVLQKCFNYISDKKILYYFKQGKNLFSIPYKDIYYFESNKRKVRVVTKKEDYYYYDTLSGVESKLGRDVFVRTHVSYFVNMDYIRSFDGKCITLENEIQIPVSKKYVNSFNESFMKYLQKN
ncbi:LytR/AlgR family response regulator transcription factor [Clostridium butyricum]|uniref:LytR/AlgR family response regulator transcription factor n=1 Tax=Clostridium butyricum TaxID=1492 RepID=UPI0032C13B7E